jgi:hypothetical protein
MAEIDPLRCIVRLLFEVKLALGLDTAEMVGMEGEFGPFAVAHNGLMD